MTLSELFKDSWEWLAVSIDVIVGFFKLPTECIFMVPVVGNNALLKTYLENLLYQSYTRRNITTFCFEASSTLVKSYSIVI